MIDAIIRSFLGGFGGKVLDFYSEHSLWINGTILLYALLVIIGRSSYSSLLRAMTTELLRMNPDTLKNKSVQSLQSIFARIELPWNTVVKKVSFPFLVPPKKMRPYFKNPENAARLIPPEILAETIYLETHKEDKPSDRPTG
ncbi:MAG: hypothetical protein JXA25_11455 [Anaerolineales bacterium]|nr:hypothetical protein [Anaerolineales bacterium]